MNRMNHIHRIEIVYQVYSNNKTQVDFQYLEVKNENLIRKCINK